MNKDRFTTVFFLVLLLSLSIFLHFIRLSYPKSVVFDEQWYGGSAASYFSHKYYFDTHPPLGKLLIAGSGYVFGFNDPTGNNFNFRFGKKYPSMNTYLPFRFLPAILGSLLPILAWLITREAGGSKKVSFLVAIFLLFDNALLLESRLILLEGILVFFSLLSVFFYFKFRKQKRFSRSWYFYLALLGFSLGAAISVKWTGLAIFLIIVFLEILRLDEERTEEKKKLSKFLAERKKQIGFFLATMFILPLIVYVFSFAVHFSLVRIPRNPKDFSDPFLYSKKEDITKPPSVFHYKETEGDFLKKFIKNQRQMLPVLSVEAKHPYQSDWWSWPIGRKAMLYFKKGGVNLYLIGNPIVWWLGFLGLFLFLFIPVFKKKEKLSCPDFFRRPEILYFYLFSWLFFIGITRTSFLYYYLTSLCFSIILFGLCFDFYTQRLSNNKKNIIWGILIAICFLSFVFYMPFTYGLPLSEKAISLRFWFPFWR